MDECLTKPSICGTAVCKNIPGNYECVCAEGYRYNSISKSCEGRVVVVSLLIVERVGLNPDLILKALVPFDNNWIANNRMAKSMIEISQLGKSLAS